MKQNIKSRKVILLFLVVMMLIFVGTISCVLISKQKSKADLESKTIKILHTNDIHASVENLSYISQYAKETENAVLVDIGDALQGNALGTYTKGSAIIELMNQSGYSVSAVGNHDFDYGVNQFKENLKLAEFPFIAANVKNVDGTTFINEENNNGEYIVIEQAGKKIGFFGITTTETAYKTNPKNVEGIEFENELLSAKEAVDKLKELECDVIVGLTHVGVANKDLTCMDLAEALDGVDIIIDGHSHTKIIKRARSGTYVVQTGSKLKYMGEISVTFRGEDTIIEPKLLNKKEYSIYGKDSEVEGLYENKQKELEKVFNQVVGKTSVELQANKLYDGKRNISIVKNRETSMGDIVADSMIWQAKELLKTTEYAEYPMVAMVNGGSIKANIKPGDITLGDIYNVLPYGSSLAVKVITPYELYKTLEYSISELKLNKELTRIQNLSSIYPQISGMRFEMNINNRPCEKETFEGERVIKIYLKDKDGKETVIDKNDKSTKIAFVSNDFLIAGGDGFEMLTKGENIAEGSVLDEVLTKYITKLTEESGGSFVYEMDGNRSVEINICNK